MKDVLEENRPTLQPRSVLVLAASVILGLVIFCNAVFWQTGETGRFVASREASARVDVIASQNSITLKYDPEVELVQRELLSTGHYRGMVDGVYGKRTKLAIEAYQKSAGLPVDGKLTARLVEHIRFNQQIAEAAEYTGSLMSDGEMERQSQVRQAQTGLSELGYSPGDITGIMTPETRNAIKEFQRQNGLEPDGEVSPLLLAELAKMSGDSSLAVE